MPIRNMTLASLFTALLAVSSYITIPIGPVPHTLQIFFVLLTGLILGRRWGVISMLLWISLGIVGLPVFAGGKAGIATLVGPTGGFLAGFIVCSYIVGWYADTTKELIFSKTLAFMLIGLIFVYVIGLLGFMGSFAFFLHKPMSWNKAATIAVLPFLPFDIIKSIIAASIGLKVRQALVKSGLLGNY